MPDSHRPLPPRPVVQARMFLTCYRDTFDYGWHHVDLFVHDDVGREVNWVHWTVEADGPEAADASVTREEPQLRRTTPWEHHLSVVGQDYWTAEAEWPEAG
ncbi:hypothetical protein P0W64_08895 [Tsukamurella sp. 8F]|uniref:hypothetical protein n=1 Tax=unclassified Tsukamurella TaxID=2633480 RepID=UPI0023B9CCE2|nr:MULTISPECIES: hypothetical protein [unclassified Tsukamurella]MDF0529276.1 hypothetical protein [Tsukamurella sp. 8J]MDF0586887.1 hypothetical protein [Tsukamurella sp. 8F]